MELKSSSSICSPSRNQEGRAFSFFTRLQHGMIILEFKREKLQKCRTFQLTGKLSRTQQQAIKTVQVENWEQLGIDLQSHGETFPKSFSFLAAAKYFAPKCHPHHPRQKWCKVMRWQIKFDYQQPAAEQCKQQVCYYVEMRAVQQRGFLKWAGKSRERERFHTSAFS